MKHLNVFKKKVVALFSQREASSVQDAPEASFPMSSPEERVSLFHDSRGLSTVEYIILMVTIVVGAISVWNSIGGDVKDRLNRSQAEISDLPEE